VTLGRVDAMAEILLNGSYLRSRAGRERILSYWVTVIFMRIVLPGNEARQGNESTVVYLIRYRQRGVKRTNQIVGTRRS